MSLRDGEPERLAAFIQAHVPLDRINLGDEYYYASLSLCVIDAVYSIGVRYEGVQNAVARYCKHFELERFRRDRDGATIPDSQERLSDFIASVEDLGVEQFASTVLRNKQRTSPQHGILKADAAYRFACTLRNAGIEDFRSALTHLDDEALDAQLALIPGQKISIGYFWMLAGTDDRVKPDRMVQRFACEALGRLVPLPQLQELVGAAVGQLRSERHDLTSRLLDYGIWSYQRTRTRRADVNAAPSAGD